METILRKIFLLWFLMLTSVCFAQTKPLPSEFATWLKSKGMTHATVAMEIARLTPDGPKTLYAYDSERSVQPASLMKLLTTSVALSLLDPNQTIPTEVYIKGEILNGTLDGDLIIKGFGDATLASARSMQPKETFTKEIIAALRKQGITNITGNIVGDGSALSQSPISTEWTWEDMGNHYAPSISGLNYGDNKYDIVLNTSKPGVKPEVIRIEPKVDDLVIDNQLLPKNYAFDSAYIYGAPHQNVRTLLGAVPHRQPQFRVKGDVPDPAQFAASQVKAALLSAGINVSGVAVSSATDLSSAILLYIHHSDNIGFIAKQTNVYSINFFAEMLIRQLALNIAKEGSETAGINVVYRFLKSKGLDTDGIAIYDGCGLAPTDRVTPHFMIGLLNSMQNDAFFKNSLPVAGRSGTIHSFLKETRLEGKAQLKTGTTKTVIGYSGYVTGSDSQLYAVSIIVNNHTCKALTVRKNIEKMLLLLIP